MRFLKTKIQRAQEVSKRLPTQNLSSSLHQEPKTSTSNGSRVQQPYTRLRAQKPINESEEQIAHINRGSNYEKRKEDTATKNIAVNYANAITSFAVSNLAVPYLKLRLEKEDITVNDFVSFINREKAKIGGICSFRALLLVEESDNAKTAMCKKVFQWIGEVFIKYFSVNWIIHGRVSHKETYLKFRFKMLRRIQNPEAFTYIKEKKGKPF